MPLCNQGLTVYRALKQTTARIGHWVAISGAGGGLGHLGMWTIFSAAALDLYNMAKAIQYALAMGLRVIAIGMLSPSTRSFRV